MEREKGEIKEIFFTQNIEKKLIKCWKIKYFNKI